MKVENNKDLMKDALVVVELENRNGPVVGKVLEPYNESGQFSIHYLESKLEGKWTLQFYRKLYHTKTACQNNYIICLKLGKDGKLPLDHY